ncbi:uncharacterized protein DC041_0011760 [Schistosoma bovis]|uniref:Uncharacterized protein n=1 Tax=Schistosoma bovis TaxID=6184 RepID=A0A430QAU9_SCHBO|nr:uncharacterized protein DC041_0011760 [Schistosoma bovis]
MWISFKFPCARQYLTLHISNLCRFLCIVIYFSVIPRAYCSQAASSMPDLVYLIVCQTMWISFKFPCARQYLTLHISNLCRFLCIVIYFSVIPRAYCSQAASSMPDLVYLIGMLIIYR